jgi:hypothetical protein
MYYGCSNQYPLYTIELDHKNSFQEIGNTDTTIYANAANHGWERRGDTNLMDEVPWIEGCWMTKYLGKYYLQYAGPGTEFKTYADGIYTSDNPLGPFEYAPYSPFSFKPTGFVTGAGHGNTFQDKEGNYWRVVTMTISVVHMFERRLGIFPAAFDADSIMHTNTVFGDYPQYLPGVKDSPIDSNFTGWMLLSHKKAGSASSILTGYGIQNAVDEDIRTFWCAQTGDSGEYLMIDLGKICQIHALQINFGEHGINRSLVSGRNHDVYIQYLIHTSRDSIDWTLLIDKSDNDKDVPHDYIQLAEPDTARYVKLTNVFTPGEGLFCVRDLRIFGNPDSATFTPVEDFTVTLDPAYPDDERNRLVTWEPVEGSDGYIVRYGIAPDKLYNHYMVYDADSVYIHSLNKGVEYYFSVEAFDGGTDYYRGSYPSGITEKQQPIVDQYKLLQNYPNPFNPSTKITYFIPASDFVVLKIYDILGREVATLVDKYQVKGEYRVTFTSKNLASGIYFCQIQVGNPSKGSTRYFVETKKMILLR